MMRGIAPLVLFVVSLASPLEAQAHPDFSGKWTLDTKASEGPRLPVAMTMAITQDASVMKVDNASTVAFGEQKIDTKGSLTYTLDGSASKNVLTNMGQSLALTSTARWEGGTLVIITQGELGPGRTMTQTDHWSLGADKRTLSLSRDVAVSGQTVQYKMAFVKQ
jgi:hypothetical protein